MIRVCDNFDISCHGCVPYGEGFKDSYNVNPFGDCLSPWGGDCRHYISDSDRVYDTEEEFIFDFFADNPKGYTAEELSILYNRIPFNLGVDTVRLLIGACSSRPVAVVETPFEELPLLIKEVERYTLYKLFFKWRLEIGR